MLTAENLRQARWFGGKSRTIADTRIVDSARWIPDSSLFLVEVTYTTGPPDTYVLAERLEEPAVAGALLAQFRGTTVRTDRGGRLEFRPTHVLNAIPQRELEPVRPMSGEQSNTSIRFGDALILKLFRRLQFGPNPDVEIGWFLTEHTRFRGTPPVAGSLSYVNPEGCEASLALLQRFERNRGDAWTTTLERLRAVLDGADAAASLEAVRRLGATTAELHLALATNTGDSAFAPEPVAPTDVDQWLRAIEDDVRATANALRQRGTDVDEAALLRRARGVRALEGTLKTRHHGDYHLGQVLERDDGSFVIIDFEGEPSRPLAQRREKRSPLRDVAGLLRSLDYARTTAARSSSASNPGGVARATAWYAAAREAFLSAYLPKARTLLPADCAPALAALELEKAAYEVMYELNNRPDWLPIPLAAFSADS
ncbi:MAG: sugar phosphotransferase [Chloroflexi bacterium]|nr:sugar phosphotransferase [Chloroflexota bacterium]